MKPPDASRTTFTPCLFCRREVLVASERRAIQPSEGLERCVCGVLAKPLPGREHYISQPSEALR